jgi:Tol biopolymer transport system component
VGIFTSDPKLNTPFAKNFDISGDGRYITFESDATTLTGDTDPAPSPDIFLFDRQTGINKIVSIGSTGTKLARKSQLPTISKDGRYIAFESQAPNLVSTTTTNINPGIFVYDRQADSLERVSLDSKGQVAQSGYAITPAISANGRYVVFTSNATLLPSDLNSFGTNSNIDDVFVRDLQTDTTEKISVSSNGVTGDRGSGDDGINGKIFGATISGDGRYVAFTSRATNLVAGDTNGMEDIFVRDRQTGTTQRVSLDKDGNQVSKFGSDFYFYKDLQLSEDGRYLSFASYVPNLVAGDTLLTEGVFLRDLQTGITTREVNYNVNTDVNGGIEKRVAVSRDARYVAYKNLEVPPLPIPRTTNLYLTDRGTSGSISSTTTTATISITPPTTVIPEVVPPIAVVPQEKPPVVIIPETVVPPTTPESTPPTAVIPEVVTPEILIPTPVESIPIKNNNPAPNERNPIISNPEIGSNLPIPGISVENNLFKTSATTKGFGISAVSQKPTNKVNEIGIFAVDDASGKIGSIAPGTPEYLKAALDIAKPIFTSLAGDFLNKVNQEFSIDPNKTYQFFEIQDGSIADARQQISNGKSPTNLLFSIPDSNGNSPIKVTNNSNNDGYQISVNADELVLNVVKLAGATVNSPIGTKSQSAPEGRTIDLTDYAGQTLKADITTTSSAAYTNNVGFYAVEDAIGTIKLADGSFVKPGDANYAAEAVKSALTNSGFQAGKTDSSSDQNITGGRIYAPVVVAQGSFDEFLAKNASNGGGKNEIHAFFNYIGANSDKMDHFRLVGANTFGVEDVYGGGDRDFNDLVVSMNVKAPAAVV